MDCGGKGKRKQHQYKTISEAASKATLIITAMQAHKKYRKEITLQCLNFFDDTKGTFILNEGDVTTEWLTDLQVLEMEMFSTMLMGIWNGTELGDVAQDITFVTAKFI